MWEDYFNGVKTYFFPSGEELTMGRNNYLH